MKNSNDTIWNLTRGLPCLTQCLNQLHAPLLLLLLLLAETAFNYYSANNSNKNPLEKRKIQISMILIEMVLYKTVCFVHIIILCLTMVSVQAETCSNIDNESVVQIRFCMTILLFACFYHSRFSIASVLNGDQRPS